MKTIKTKICALILALMLMLSLAACGGNSEMPSGGTSAPPSLPTTTPSQAATSVPSELKDGDFICAQIATDGPGHPLLRIVGIYLVFKGDTQNHPIPEIVNFKIYIDGEVQNTGLEPDSGYANSNFDDREFNLYSVYNDVDTLYSFSLTEDVTQKPAEYYFECTLNGVEIRSNTLVWNEDDTYELLNDAPVLSERPVILDVPTDTPTSQNTAPVAFNFSNVTESAYSLTVENLSGNDYKITIHDENLAETYMLNEHLSMMYEVNNIFRLDIAPWDKGEVNATQNVQFANMNGTSNAEYELDFANKNIIVTVTNDTGKAWSNRKLTLIVIYGDGRTVLAIEQGTGGTKTPVTLSDMTLPNQFVHHEWDSQYFKVATDDYMVHEVYDRWQQGQIPDTLCDVVSVRSFDNNGNVVYMVTKLIFDKEEEARVYYEYLQGANVAAGDKSDQLCVNTGLVVYHDFANVADKMNKQGNVDRYTADGVNFWCSKP